MGRNWFHPRRTACVGFAGRWLGSDPEGSWCRHGPLTSSRLGVGPGFLGIDSIDRASLLRRQDLGVMKQETAWPPK